ncbi:MAG: endonuclease NucS domain-containing protein [Candidatus Velamenicoccus archaeovorus]
MEAILFSVNPDIAKVDDGIRHLAEHPELYWETGWPVIRKFKYPILGYMHIKRKQVEYIATIKDIIPFSPRHYEDLELSQRVKPAIWIKEWKENVGGCRLYKWKSALVMTRIEPFSYDTCQLEQYKGGKVSWPPQRYIQVLPPIAVDSSILSSSSPSMVKYEPPLAGSKQKAVPAERHLEDFVVLQLQEIESGLRLLERQLSTSAGRLDLLCQDAQGGYVIVELKRHQGTDQVVGQILRYMGWVKENYATDQVRGVIVVAKKDATLSYAIKAAPNIQVKEFKLTIE